MAQLLTDPSNAYVLGTLSDLHRDHRMLTASVARAQGDTSALEAALGALAERKRSLFDLRAEGHSTARQLGEKNQLLGELLPKLTKLRARSEALRESQLATANTDPETARARRRSRAVVNVQIEDLEQDCTKLQAQAQALRDRLHALDGQMRAGRAQEQAAQDAVTGLQAGHPALPDCARLCAVRLAMAHGRLRCAGPVPSADDIAAWAEEVRAVAGTWEALNVAMAAGRFVDDATQTLMGGRSSLTSEVLAGLVALGDLGAARSAFGRMCADHGFLHQIFFVFRAFCLGLYVEDQQGPLVEALRMHRYAQGLRGALAECLWQLIRGDGDAFARLLPQVVALEANMWATSEMPGLGLISLMGCALCRLGAQRGLAVPTQLGPTVPQGPWSVAPAALLR